MALSHVSGTFGSILGLNHLNPRAFPLEILAGLVDGHVMGPYLFYVLQGLSRQCHQILVYVKVDLSLDLGSVTSEEVEIRKKSS